MKKKLSIALIIAMLCTLGGISEIHLFGKLAPVANAADVIPAFPGAEGGGKYVTGGRGGEVYVVTNLNDSGPGSFRDAVSQSNRIIVFQVSGNIHLKSRLKITGSNLTIAGQSAPGDGIALLDYDTSLDGDNVIIRYMRFRLGDKFHSEEDSFGARKRKNIILDHCSFSHSVDEVLSPYQMENMTVQWSIIAESMLMSNHVKGRHGYGGIWGGKNTTFHHNLLAHNASRNPRFAGDEGDTLDFRNNILYNWQFMTAYGGEKANGNIVGNYYKYGPDTDETKRSLLRDTPLKTSRWFIEGNIVDGYPKVTENNWLGLPEQPDDEVKLQQAVKMPNTYVGESAQAAYESVLAQVGASYPVRDSMDARVVNEVRERTGRLSNSPAEAGGFPQLPSVQGPLDSDQDGIPDQWEIAHGLNPKDAKDSQKLTASGYTYLETYLNELVKDHIPVNPSVKLTAPEAGTIVNTNSNITLKSEASPSQSSNTLISKVQFYANEVLIGEVKQAPYQYEWENVKAGSYYITARAFDAEGVATDSSSRPVHVVDPMIGKPWNTKDIGSLRIAGHTSEANGVITVRSGGRIGGTGDPVEVDKTVDAFHYAYQSLEGDGEIVARIDELGKIDNEAQAGIMIRSSLDEDAKMVALMQSIVKFGNTARFIERTTTGGEAKVEQVPDFLLPGYVKLVRMEDKIYGFLSQYGYGDDWVAVGVVDAKDWPKKIYLGLAVDAASINNDIANYNIGRFAEVKVSQINALPSITEGLKAKPAKKGIQLNWNKTAEATSYKIERSFTEAGPYVTIAKSVKGLTYTDKTAEQGNLYYYRIIASNKAGDTLPSQAVEGYLKQGLLKQYTMKDDFDHQKSGTAPTGYTISPLYPGNEQSYVRVEQSPKTIKGNQTKNVLHMQGTVAEAATITKRLTPAKEQVTFELNISVPTGNHRFQLIENPGGKTAARLNVTKEGLSYSPDSKTIIPLDKVKLETGKWYTLKIQADVTTGKYTLYVNNQLVAEQLPFVDKLEQIGAFYAYSESSLFIDSIYAYQNVKR